MKPPLLRTVFVALIVAAPLLFAAPARCGDKGVVVDDTGITFIRPEGCHDPGCLQLKCPHNLSANQRKAYAALTKRNRHRIDALSCWERLDFLAQYSRLSYSASDYNRWLDETLEDPPVSLLEYKRSMWSMYPALAR